MKNNQIPFYLLVNRAELLKRKESTHIPAFRQRSRKSFILEKASELFGVLPEDNSIPQAVKFQKPFSVFNTRSPASKALMKITEKYWPQGRKSVKQQ